jgi:hypothetical protein
MSLREIQKDLQKRESEVIKREHDTTEYDVWRSQEKSSVESEVSNWQKIKDHMQNTRVRGIVYGGIALLALTVILLSVVSFVYYQKGFFSQDRVILSMEAPDAIDSNKLTEIAFVYNNNNRADISDVEIAVQFGNYFVPSGDQDGFTRVSDSQGVIRIGSLRGHEKGRFVLAGYFVGPKGSVNTVFGTLRYIPEETNTRYETNARVATTMLSSPVSIDVESPLEIVNGNLMNIVFKIKNTSDSDLSKLKFVVDMPETFSLYNASPLPNYANTWLIDSITARAEMTIVVRGGISAAVGTNQSFHARVLAQEEGDNTVEYANIAYAPHMIRSPITVQQKIENSDGVVYAGDRLTYIVTFANDSDIPLRDAIVTVNLDSAVLDYADLDLLNDGDYDQANRRIVWKASDVPALKILGPKATGEVRFTVPVLRDLPVKSEKDFHFSTSSIASIDSEDIPSELRENKTVLSNILTIPVGAKMIYEPAIAFASGSKQLKVGEKTVYTVTLRVDSINNDVDDVKVYIPLPTHMKYESAGRDNGMEYNERTNEITWNIGKVAHGTGITSDPLTSSFDVSIVPSVDQIEKVPVIIRDQKLTGFDVFAQRDVEVKKESITTDRSTNQSVEEKTVRS